MRFLAKKQPGPAIGDYPAASAYPWLGLFVFPVRRRKLRRGPFGPEKTPAQPPSLWRANGGIGDVACVCLRISLRISNAYGLTGTP